MRITRLLGSGAFGDAGSSKLKHTLPAFHPFTAVAAVAATTLSARNAAVEAVVPPIQSRPARRSSNFTGASGDVMVSPTSASHARVGEVAAAAAVVPSPPRRRTVIVAGPRAAASSTDAGLLRDFGNTRSKPVVVRRGSGVPSTMDEADDADDCKCDTSGALLISTCPHVDALYTNTYMHAYIRTHASTRTAL